jgi:hypothetical protein
MEIQLVKLNEVAGIIFEIKSILKMLKSHARRTPCRKMGHAHEG